MEIGGYDMDTLSLGSLINLCGISEEDFFLLFENINSKAASYGLDKALKASVFFDRPNQVITIPGVYAFFKIATEINGYSYLEKYANYFKEMAFHDLIGYYSKNEITTRITKDQNNNG